MGFLISTLEQGIIFGITALGVYITYSILDFPDLSVDGTFVLGASVAALSIVKGVNPLIALIIALICGILGGALTGILHVKFGISSLLSGILVMTALYSVNLRIMGKANLPIFNSPNIFNDNSKPLFILLIFIIIIKIVLDLFFNTKLGFILKATGDNEALVTSLGLNKGNVKLLGLMISNGIVAFSGAIMVEYQRFSDISMGTGVVIMALASIIIGNSIFRNSHFLKGTTQVMIGAVIYKLIVALALRIGFPPTDLKLITSLIVVITIVINNGRTKSFKKLWIRRGGENA